METRLWWRLLWGLSEAAFGRNVTSVAVKMFSRSIYFIMELNTNFILLTLFAKIILKYNL
jgi:hypothetical protein